jgi:hypothetical protein
MVIHAYNPSTRELKQEGDKFKDGLDNIVRLCLKKKTTTTRYQCTIE